MECIPQTLDRIFISFLDNCCISIARYNYKIQDHFTFLASHLILKYPFRIHVDVSNKFHF